MNEDDIDSKAPGKWESDSPGDDPSSGDPSGGEPSGGEPSGGEPSGGEPSGGDPSTNETLDETEAFRLLLDRTLEAFKSDPFDPADLEYVAELGDAETADLLESLPQELRDTIWLFIPDDRHWPVLNALQSSTAGHLVTALSEHQRSQLIRLADDADIQSLAGDLPASFLDALLEEVSDERATEVQAALAYDAGQVGRHLDTNILRVRPRLPIARLLVRMQSRSEAPPEAVFVVDREGTLQGRLDFSDVLAADPSEYVGSLAKPVRSNLDTDLLEDVVRAIDVVEAGDWLPVIRENKVVGAVSPGVLIRELQQQTLVHLVTDAGVDEEDLFTPVKVAARVRALWLLINLATAFLASMVIGLFEDVVQKVVTMAVLMPVVASMGGIAGSQTLAVALRGLALNHLTDANLRMVVVKELRIAVVNGLVLGAFIGLVVWQWFASIPLGAIIFCAVVVNGLAAAVAGTVVPFWLKRKRIDPAVSGSVILTTVTDVVGFFVFLGLGTVVFLVV